MWPGCLQFDMLDHKDRLVDVPVVDSAVNPDLVDVGFEQVEEVVVGPSGVGSSWTGVVRLAFSRPADMARVDRRRCSLSEVDARPSDVV